MDGTTSEAARPRWTDLASLGLLMGAAAPVLFLIAAGAFRLDIGDEIGFFVITIVIPVAAVLLLRRFGTWAKVVGAIVAALLGLMFFWTAFGLLRPTSFFDFLPGVLVIPGALIALVSCIASIVAGRRGHTGARASGGEQRAISIVLTVIVVAAVASGVATFAAKSSASSAGVAAEAHMKNFKFSPIAYTVAGGSEIFVKNDDPFVHTFTVDALGIDERIAPLSSKRITIGARAGSYILYCSLHTGNKEKPSKDDMAATLVVQ